MGSDQMFHFIDQRESSISKAELVPIYVWEYTVLNYGYLHFCFNFFHYPAKILVMSTFLP